MKESFAERAFYTKKLVDVLGVAPWRRIFENPKRLASWITFQLGVAHGSRALEQALLSQHLSQLICHVCQHHGFLHAAKYLKTSKLLLYKALAEDPDKSFCPGGKLVQISLSRSGCPRLVLKSHRRLFRNSPDSDRALDVARMYVTALDVYKLIVCDPGPVDLSTLVAGSPEGPMFLLGTRMVRTRPTWFLSLLEAGVPHFRRMPLITGFGDKVIWTASPIVHPLCNSAYWREQALMSYSHYMRESYELLARAYICWPGGGGLRRAHRDPTLESGEVPVSWRTPIRRDLLAQRTRFATKAILQDLYDSTDWSFSVSELREWIPCMFPIPRPRGFLDCTPHPRNELDRMTTVGSSIWISYISPKEPRPKVAIWEVARPQMMRLASKIEPAGKVRVFTILDSLSQRLLLPIHDWFFDLLRLIPQDGTFGQLRPLCRVTGRFLSSIDLKSATDRMPAQFTAGLIAALFNPEISRLWLQLMRRRVSSGSVVYKGAKPPLRFVQGTPLGALSAWPAFALTHHLIVQDSAARAGVVGWYTNYAIVGDDLVIGDPAVAKEYHCWLEHLFVKVSREKSISSTNSSGEFCSRFRWRGLNRDASPISFKAVTAARRRAELMSGILARLSEWKPRSISEVCRIMGWGFRSLARLPLIYRRGMGVVSKRKFYGWLLQFHPLKEGGWSWTIWLSAGRGSGLIPPWILGSIHSILLQRFFDRLSGEGLAFTRLSDEEDEQDEEMLYRPWVAEQLQSQLRTLQGLVAGDIITCLLRSPPYKTTLSRTSSVPKGRSQEAKLIKVYELATRLLRGRPPPLLEA